MGVSRTISRRAFMAEAGAAGGLLLALRIGGDDRTAGIGAAQPAAPFTPNAWLRIAPDGAITVRVHKAEMGQGVWTSLPMLVAEELDAAWETVAVEFAYGDPVFGSPALFGQEITFGSLSVRESWEPLRLAGATARAMLVEAAAQTWAVNAGECRTERSEVIHVPSGRRLGYGPLAAVAAGLPVPVDAALKEPADFRLIGTPVPRVDAPAKVDGSAVYGIDISLPGMVTASIVRSPVFGGRVRRYDASAALAVPGVRRVLELPAESPGGSRLAVVADGYWPAKRGRDALVVEWDEGAGAAQSGAAIGASFRALLEQPGTVARDDGDALGALATAKSLVEAEYETPFLAHATMEPPTCTAAVRADGVDVWVGHQNLTLLRQTAAGIAGLPPEAVTVHQTYLGCGLGRRGEVDFVADAVLVAKEIAAPVKVVWSREDDIRHDFYRPATVQRIRAALDDRGMPLAWAYQTVGDSFLLREDPGAGNGGPPAGQAPPDGQTPPADGQGPPPAGQAPAGASAFAPFDFFLSSGLDADFPYAVPNVRAEVSVGRSGIPVGPWRGIGHTQNVFAVESFVDELAAAAGIDPYEYRRALLRDDPRGQRVLDLAAERAGWGQPLAADHGRGIAICRYGETWAAQTAEVALGEGEDFALVRLVCALDCGIAVNPDTVEAQAVGGIVFGLTAALQGAITIAGGRVEQGNFGDYPLLRFDETPPVEVHLVPSANAPGGVGEAAVPPVAPAVANAIFAASGRRLRSLPLRPAAITGTA